MEPTPPIPPSEPPRADPEQGSPAPAPPVPPAVPAGPPAPPAGPYPAPGPYAAPGPYTSPGMPYAGVPGLYGPYGPYGQPRPTTNGLAVGSLVSGIVCCLPPLGLVLGLCALPQIKKRGQNGKGLAVAGIALSTISTLLVVIGLITGQVQDAVRSFGEGMRDAASSSSPIDMKTGECFRDDAEEGEYIIGVRVVDCADAHDGEIAGHVRVTGYDAWPGEKKLTALGEDRCASMVAGYALDTWALPADSGSLHYFPDRASWRDGERRIVCALGMEKPVRGTLRSDRGTLTADQSAFLLQVNPVEDAVYEEPEADAEEDFRANTAWAGDVREAIDAARRGLRARDWPQEARTPLTAYLAGLDKASKQWEELATAPDADAFWAAYDRAWELLPEDGSAEVRGALGLTDTPRETDAGRGAV
ncbi:DUF4190 domain-containing protein [Streptomyces termitum]|uniref:DUF4190 domain-containing protein n=1 Tax=Streptomyces termitum TaxID=67368 RepID=A0A918SUT4_9ACTN|nr:DUF4190 domain-containing protein [Streptomyces termitum]GHA72520.1 hypothetical protein GCM10010305_13490 [Streptomyces termitum]